MINSSKLHSNLFCDSRVFWEWITEKLRYDNEKIIDNYEIKISKDSLIMNVMNLEEYRWLGNVPIESLNAIREEGELQDLRGLFRRDVAELNNASYLEYEEVANQINYNLENAFKKHQTKLDDIEARAHKSCY